MLSRVSVAIGESSCTKSKARGVCAKVAVGRLSYRLTAKSRNDDLLDQLGSDCLPFRGNYNLIFQTF